MPSGPESHPFAQIEVIARLAASPNAVLAGGFTRPAN
jgi:hypothetical protein